MGIFAGVLPVGFMMWSQQRSTLSIIQGSTAIAGKN
jgi:hypothetical protein